MNPLRIVFAGTPDFSVPALHALDQAGFRPLAVFTQPARPAGRGRGLRASPVKQAAENLGITVHQPVRLDAPARELLLGMHADLLLVVAYGLILPQAVLDLPRLGCWNIHASLLPRWRGAAPIQRAIEAGDRQSGVCIMQMDAGLDTGAVLHRVATPIHDDDTGSSLHDRLSGLGAEALLHCVTRAAQDAPLVACPQPKMGITYAGKLDKAQAQLDWQQPAILLERQVRAFNPWPVAWCELNGQRLRVWRATITSGQTKATPGSVLDTTAGGIDIAAGQGALRLQEVQPEGGRRMPVTDFLNSRRL
jgi:methionyl-tRNA formyltransferase